MSFDFIFKISVSNEQTVEECDPDASGRAATEAKSIAF